MPGQRRSLLATLDRLGDHSVLVVGDVVLDEYLVGAPSRLSREAPVLVLEYRRRFLRPGGGANPAVNLKSLGARPRLLGVIGRDAAGRALRGALRRAGLDPTDLVVAPGQPTISKTRILADTANTLSQQVVRLDRQGSTDLSEPVQQQVSARIKELSAQVQAVLLSDYKGGVVGTATIAAARSAAADRHCLLTADSQGELERFTGFFLVKCNLSDAEASLGRTLRGEADFRAAGRSLVHDLDLGCLVITRGPDGMSLATADGDYAHLPASNRTEVYDVTGAGDTVVAVLTLALVSGANPKDAAGLANLAAGLVVRRLGVATTTREELRQLLGAA